MQQENTPERNKELVADWQALMRTFICPDNDVSQSRLVKYMQQILFGFRIFKETRGHHRETSLKDLVKAYSDSHINENPEKKLTDVTPT